MLGLFNDVGSLIEVVLVQLCTSALACHAVLCAIVFDHVGPEARGCRHAFIHALPLGLAMLSCGASWWLPCACWLVAAWRPAFSWSCCLAVRHGLHLNLHAYILPSVKLTRTARGEGKGEQPSTSALLPNHTCIPIPTCNFFSQAYKDGEGEQPSTSGRDPEEEAKWAAFDSMVESWLGGSRPRVEVRWEGCCGTPLRAC